MLLIERAEQVEVHLPVGVIVIHADLLSDDALFLGNRSLGEIGLGDKLQQDAQALLKMVGAGEEIGSLVKGGIGIGVGAGLGILGEGIAVLAVEHLVFQIMAMPSGTVTNSDSSLRRKLLSMEPYLVANSA